MQMPKSKYEQTKICDVPQIKEMKSVQDIFSVVSIEMKAECLNFQTEDFPSCMY